MKAIFDFTDQAAKHKLYDYLKSLRPMKYVIEVKENRETRSNNQNAYYWGVVLNMLSNETGFTSDEMHELLKSKFLRYFKMLEATAEEVQLTRSTTDLNTKEFEEYLEEVRRFAAQEIDLQIPLPNEVIEV